MTRSIEDHLNAEARRRIAAERATPPPDPKAWIDPLNPYSGNVSILLIARNLANGHPAFPHGMGDLRNPPRP